MPVTIKYIGTSDNYAELPVTGKQSIWQIGQQEERPDNEASLLMATGLFYSPPVPVFASTNLTGGLENIEVGDISIGISTALRQVATRSYIPEHRGAGIHQLMARSKHVSRDVMRNFKLVFPSWCVLSGTTETAQGAASQITASIEYPVGTFTQVTFAGSATGNMPDNVNFVSDSISVKIPKGADFYVRTWASNATALVYNGIHKSLTGEGFVSSATTTPDLTMGGAVTQATVNMYGPCAVIAQTTKRAIGIYGDSIGYGTNDAANTGDIGIIARSIGASNPYIHVAIPSDFAGAFITSHTNRLALADYCSDIIIQYGTNDIPGTASAVVLANLATVAGYFTGKNVYFNTIPPRTTSSDSWATTANQTATANESTRVAVNTGIRSIIAGSAGSFDVADVAETARNSGIWRIDTGSAAPATTADGVHPNPNMYTWVKGAGAINPALFG